MYPGYEGLSLREKEPAIETVRGAIFYRGKFLLLQKESTSDNPNVYEFPGGQIENIKGDVADAAEQEQALANELAQETGLNLSCASVTKVDDFSYYFETRENEKRAPHRRNVHLFLVTLPDSVEVTLQVNQTLNEKGESEDKHRGYKWVSPEELRALVLTLEENQDTHKNQKMLSRNSRHIKRLLASIDTSNAVVG